MINVLYVDDDKNNLESFYSLFRKKFNIKTTTSIDECYKIISDSNINVFITDQKMSPILGTELINNIKKIDDKVVCILTSAYYSDKNNNTYYQFLEKPWDIQKLEDTIEEAYELNKIKKNHRSFIGDMFLLIEKQHKIIDENIKKLEDLIINRYKPLTLIDDIINDLYYFYEVHFVLEETLMDMLKIKNEEHVNEHRNFLIDILKIKDSIELIIFLKKWNNEHIDSKDFKSVDKFKEYLKSCEI